MKSRTYDIAIIGGGIVGCALARELVRRVDRVVLLEKEASLAFHTSGRNSGVVHSGFNPSPGTLKAKLCVEGSQKIRQFCEEHRIPYEQVGTYVVAGEESQIPFLHELKTRGEKNGVPGIEIISIEEMEKNEPNVKGVAAVFSPTGAIVDSKLLTLTVANEAKKQGVDFNLCQEVVGLSENPDSVELTTNDNTYNVKLMINCAGLHADRLAHMMGLGSDYMVVPFRGEYFVMAHSDPPLIRSMIYPVPNPAVPFLGIHLTKMVNGSVLIGPNAVPAFGREAYHGAQFNVKDFISIASSKGIWNALLHNHGFVKAGFNELIHSCSKRHFLREAGKLVRGLSLKDIQLATRVGIRPQLIKSDGCLVEDLVIETTERTVHVLNVVSPGMTSALAFAEWFGSHIDGSLQWTCTPEAIVC